MQEVGHDNVGDSGDVIDNVLGLEIALDSVLSLPLILLLSLYSPLFPLCLLLIKHSLMFSCIISIITMSSNNGGFFLFIIVDTLFTNFSWKIIKTICSL